MIPQGAGAAGEAGPGQAPVRSAAASDRPRRSPPNKRPPITLVLCFHLEVRNEETNLSNPLLSYSCTGYVASELMQGDPSGQLKPPVDLNPTVLAGGGPPW